MRLLLVVLFWSFATILAWPPRTEKSEVQTSSNGFHAPSSTTPSPRTRGYFFQDLQAAKRQMRACIEAMVADDPLGYDEWDVENEEDLRAQIACFHNEEHLELRVSLNLLLVAESEDFRGPKECGHENVFDFVIELTASNTKATAPTLSPGKKCGAATALLVPFCKIQRTCASSRLFEALAAYHYTRNRYEANRSAGRGDSCPHDWSPLGRHLNPLLYTDRFDHKHDEVFLEDVCARDSDDQDANRTKPL
ncbi:hypothetical protein M3Y99_00654900 [Aphelenchoides fujianensis]|nr:hypothetical protein M3Y99_00654900 [Aphelenchoides fujianensis]